MGANMAVAWIPSCEIDDVRLHELQGIIKFLTEQDCIDATGAYEDIDEALDDWKVGLTDSIGYIRDNHYSREIIAGMRVGDGYPVDITGGMSCGDCPTEAYDSFAKIGECEKLFNKLEEWAKADYSRGIGKNVL